MCEKILLNQMVIAAAFSVFNHHKESTMALRPKPIHPTATETKLIGQV